MIALGALGLRDLERKLPATKDTLFPIGSCTKSFTAMAVAAAPFFKMADGEADGLVTLRDMRAASPPPPGTSAAGCAS